VPGSHNTVESVEKLSPLFVEKCQVPITLWKVWKSYPQGLWISQTSLRLAHEKELSTEIVDNSGKNCVEVNIIFEYEKLVSLQYSYCGRCERSAASLHSCA
jgi:hypothetical protein